jgi:hypothetical protein
VNLEVLTDRDAALTVPCPERRCLAPVRIPCRSLATGAELVHQAAHYARLSRAGVQAGRAWLGPNVPRETHPGEAAS